MPAVVDATGLPPGEVVSQLAALAAAKEVSFDLSPKQALAWKVGGQQGALSRPRGPAAPSRAWALRQPLRRGAALSTPGAEGVPALVTGGAPLLAL
jgi:hypothetical protein